MKFPEKQNLGKQIVGVSHSFERLPRSWRIGGDLLESFCSIASLTNPQARSQVSNIGFEEVAIRRDTSGKWGQPPSC